MNFKYVILHISDIVLHSEIGDRTAIVLNFLK
jgi:hypothetical protein